MGLILWVAFCFWRYMVFLAIDTMEGLMPAALAITRDGWAAEDLRALARSSRDAEWTARLLAIALVLDGEGREAAGRAVGVDRQTVRDWVVRYNAAGPDGLRNRPRPGRACRLTDAQLAVVRGWMESGPDPAADGVSRWRTCDIRRKIEGAFGAAYTDEGVRRLLRRLGFRWVSGRPEHPRGDAAARAGFRSAFGALVTAAVRKRFGEAGLDQGMEIWFQDEARVGQKGSVSRVWAPRGSRPRVVRDHRHGYCYLFGAACGARGKAVGLVFERADTAAMNAHLAAIGAAVADGACGVVVLDGAGWHRSKGLVVPDNIVLLPLPPYSPELNPMETVIQFLRGNRWSNRVFDSVGAVKAACREAWEWLRSSPERIASLMRREWACLPKVPA